MIPAPGWAIVKKVTHEESFGGQIVVPASLHDRLARYQAELVCCATQGSRCRNDECPRRHLDGYHVPPELTPSDWLLLAPRSLVPLPGVLDQSLVPQDAIWAVLEA